MKKLTLFIAAGLLACFSMNAQTTIKKFKATQKTVAPVKLPIPVTGNIASIQKKQAISGNNVKLIRFQPPITKTDVQLLKRNGNGTPIFIEKKSDRLKSGIISTPEQQCYEFLNAVKSEMQVNQNTESFHITNVSEDLLGQKHIRLLQKFKGIKVYNADLYVHIKANSELLNGRFFNIPEHTETKFQINPNNALQKALSDLSLTSQIHELTESQKSLFHFEPQVIDTVWLNTSGNNFRLAYYITIRPNIKDEWRYFIDAQTSEILKKYNNTAYDGPATANALDLNNVSRSINTYLEAGKYYMINIAEPMFNATKGEGMIRTLNAQNTSTKNLSYIDVTTNNNTWNNPSAVSAHYNATQTYRYFKNTFNRNSINGLGGNIISLINVNDEDGQSMDNAFWNGAAIFYGNGLTAFKPLAGALDVAAHEIGHGVTQNTAGLEYQGESGAMNEAFSDIFGAMVDRSNWFIGESVTKTSYISTGRLRDMSDPHNGNGNGWQPKHTSEMYKGTDDNGGVHINSGIINYAFYLYATSITKEKAEQVFYRALANYLTKSSHFIDLRIAVVQSAKDLYGESSVELTQAKAAFDAVGIYEEQPVEVVKTYPENPGQDYFIMNNTDSADPNTLYRSSTTATDFVALTSTPMLGKPSVVDNGSYAVYVSADHKIRSITLGNGTPSESILSNDTIWDNAAISKDGNRLAAITRYIDSAIYVYDYISAHWSKFKLFSPTTQEGVINYNVNYADAIEFDHTGQYLIYDAFNTINSSTGTSINYWDIGILKVWNNKTNTFGDGSIAKLYGSLPENVSIGNPTFSKNSANIIAFDYLNETANEYAVYGLNLETYDLGLIASNNTIGFPTFSKSDDKVAYGSLNNSSRPVINVANLNADKISSSSNPVTVILEAEWPIYYATGTRVLGLSPVADFTVSYKTGTPPFEVKFTDNSQYEPTSWEWTFEGGTPGTSSLQNPTVIYNSNGNYSVTLKVTNSFGNNTLVKSGYIVVTDVKEIETEKDYFQLINNPVTEKLRIKKSMAVKSNYTISIYDVTGKLWKQAADEDEIDVAALHKGIYVVKITWGNQSVQLKMLKE